MDDEIKWVVAIRYNNPIEMVSRVPIEELVLTIDGERVVEFGDPDCFVVANYKNLREEHGRYDTIEAANEAAEELNRYAVQGPLDPAFSERRKRLKRLSPLFNSFFYEGPKEARWPARPERYLIHDCGVGWHPEESQELVDDLAAVEAVIAGDESNVWKVIDLDTGDEVEFEREVIVRFVKS